jgi:hypothetical protein
MLKEKAKSKNPKDIVRTGIISLNNETRSSALPEANGMNCLFCSLWIDSTIQISMVVCDV